jgi:hypothetical protein
MLTLFLAVMLSTSPQTVRLDYSFAPGDSISYSFPKLPAGDYLVTLTDDVNNETIVPASLKSGALTFSCPSLAHGFYQIDELQNTRTHKTYYVTVDGTRGFEVR